MHLCFVQLLYFTHAHNVKENNPLFSVLSFIPLDCKLLTPFSHPTTHPFRQVYSI